MRSKSALCTVAAQLTSGIESASEQCTIQQCTCSASQPPATSHHHHKWVMAGGTNHRANYAICLVNSLLLSFCCCYFHCQSQSVSFIAPVFTCSAVSVWQSASVHSERERERLQKTCHVSLASTTTGSGIVAIVWRGEMHRLVNICSGR